ncbi:MAG: rRNA maturation RNase YbeY [Desulfitobacteriia bacterium]
MILDISWEEDSTNEEEKQRLVAVMRRGIQKALLLGSGGTNYELGLVLVGDRTIQNLNQTYRGIDQPTDVLSFALQEKGEGEPEIFLEGILEGENSNASPEVLGDVVISVERARAQAVEYHHSLDREMAYLAVHGTLHLLGYNHGSEEEEQKMRDVAERVMEELNLGRKRG